MDLLFIGLTVGTVGKVLLGVTVIAVHCRIVKAHRINQAVLREMNTERNISIAAIVLIILGYTLELIHHGYLVSFF